MGNVTVCFIILFLVCFVEALTGVTQHMTDIVHVKDTKNDFKVHIKTIFKFRTMCTSVERVGWHRY